MTLRISKQAVCHDVCDWKACEIEDSPAAIAVSAIGAPNIRPFAAQIVYNLSA
ncbi:hypothetical protein [Rhodopseudomonas sp. P2A-2r]|uniref:hypothetical protein n=1 Tax=unclassified Rhodopseudomonas TaxID=2638247 RepID=UPI002234263E|nr:hypothetical protein [Rhodopseudomonas sp. P2A-2r]UZE48901.1 hypothetical protein ONR75_29900 [Rhodopseudomonas sp. P2A-2r]